MPCTIKPQQANDIARFLHICNKELDMPGFCMDEDSATIFYRLMSPSTKKEIAKEVLQSYLSTMETICTTFFPAIQALSAGAVTLDAMLKQSKQASP